jgi:hypothetical protein
MLIIPIIQNRWRCSGFATLITWKNTAADTKTLIIQYKLVGDRVEKRIVQSRRLRGEPRPDPSFHHTLLKAHYQVECEQGSRYRSGYTKNQTKRVLEGAMARHGAS